MRNKQKCQSPKEVDQEGAGRRRHRGKEWWGKNARSTGRVETMVHAAKKIPRGRGEKERAEYSAASLPREGGMKTNQGGPGRLEGGTVCQGEQRWSPSSKEQRMAERRAAARRQMLPIRSPQPRALVGTRNDRTTDGQEVDRQGCGQRGRNARSNAAPGVHRVACGGDHTKGC